MTGTERWGLATAAFTCGYCGVYFKAGVPIRRVALPHVRRVMLRCAKCAGEGTPSDLTPGIPEGRLSLTQVDEDGIERPVSPAQTVEAMRKPFVDFSARLLGEK